MAHHALQHLAKAGVGCVQPGAGHHGDVELRAICVWPSVGHAHPAWSVVAQNKVLVAERLAVDTVAARAVSLREVPALHHEVGNDTMELRATVPVAFLRVECVRV